MEFMQPEEEAKLIKEYNERFPYKVELHCHLDGAVRPETVLDIAKKRGMQDDLPHKTVDELNKDVILTEPASLERFLKSFDYFMPVLAGYEPAIDRIAYELCEDCHKHNIKYMEVRYCPHLLCNSIDNLEYTNHKGTYTPRDVVITINKALERGMKDFNVTVNTILCCITHIPEWCGDILALCQEFKGQCVVAIDMAAAEFTPGADSATCPFKQTFQKAAKLGIHRTVHAGEVGTPQAVTEALDHMLAERIGHGYHSLDDPAVYNRIVKDKVHLEICPISSIITKACCEDIQKHPLKTFVKDNVNFSINTDDPVVLGNTLTDDYKIVHDMGISDDDIIKGIFNAARSCFATEDKRKEILQDLTKIYEWCGDILALCQEFKGQCVVAIDMAAAEFTPGADSATCPFKQTFQKAAKLGIHRTVHAGEVGTPQAVTEALDHMLAERIGHGYHSLDDPAVYNRIVKDKVHLEICPISSIITKACCEDIQKHPLKTFVKDNVNFSINTDDPVVLGNTLTDDYKIVHDMGISDDDIIKGIFNAARSCFATEDKRKEILQDLTKIYGPH